MDSVPFSHDWEQRFHVGDHAEVHEKGGSEREREREHCLLSFNWLEELDCPNLHISL